ncbi:hypothetical protein Poli38472_000013 [Pythium oligandrum]|uniref:PCI domain-containing protein n=1 Tax=Pythium oligandrum TaxID=41045 RepID=A0A8K1FEZ0_PYTOL|nr:hypothetical protein Poli38472_000013 [Pythium oligandrum]|eukprot:TMW59971.1 hypothetical protein Poli38472_000013 [Pythium oligandrum]
MYSTAEVVHIVHPSEPNEVKITQNRRRGQPTMSDSEEYEYEYDSDDAYNSDEQMGEGEEGECEERSAQIELENTFYEAEDFRQRGDLTNALAYFQRVVQLEKESVEPENAKWSFQSYGHIVKLSVSAKNWEAMLTNYQEMLAFLPYVTRNESTDAISSILDVVSAATGEESSTYVAKVHTHEHEGEDDVSLLMNRVQRWRMYLEMQQFMHLRRLLDELYVFCQTPDGSPDQSKATMQLDVYALEIQLCGATKDSAKLREIYPKTVDLDGAVADPRIMGLIREEGGKMYMEEREWMLAYNEFFESFRNYQEAGQARATQCLKYVVLANMLASSDINPFDSREAKVYQDVEEIGAMLLLRSAYESNDIQQFEKILKNPKYKLLSDPIMTKYLNPLLRNIRCQVMKSYVRPYRIMQMANVAKAVNVPLAEAEEIAVTLIQNGELQAKIHQLKGLLIMEDQQRIRETAKMFDAVDHWARALDSVHSAVVSRMVQT